MRQTLSPIVDPYTGDVLERIPIDRDPGRLVISDDGQVIHMETDDRHAVQPFYVEDPTLGTKFWMPDNRSHTLRSYDMDTLSLSAAIDLQNIPGNTDDLRRFGDNGLAFHTYEGELVLVQSDELFGITARGVLRNDLNVEQDKLATTLVEDVSRGELTIGLPRGTSGPRITHVELIQGTIFEGVEDLPTDIGSPNLTQTAFYTLALVGSVPKVPANGTLVRLTLDSTGLFHGQWDLKLSDVLPYGEYGGPYSTNLAGIAAEIHNGSLVIPVSMGDFNNDTLLDVNDIDALSQEIRSQQHTATFDLTDDGLVNIDDLLTWVETIKRTHVGDSNLDGEFGSGDLVQVFQAGEYEDGVAGNSSWSTGDWDADSQFGTGDLVLAFQRGGFELGPKATAVQVPEPSALSGLVIGCLFFFLKRRSTGA